MDMYEALKIINDLQKEGLLNNTNVTVRVPQDDLKEFSPEQLDILLKEDIISNDEYNNAKQFWHDCEVMFTTRMQIVLSTGKRIEFPFDLLRCAGDVDSISLLVQAGLITSDEYNRELNRRQKAINKFNELTNRNTIAPQQEGSIRFINFVVLSNVFKCNKNHHIDQIQATINILTPKGTVENHQVSAGYCVECGIYFILESDYNRLSQLGVLLCRKLTRDVYVSNGDSIISGDEFNTESLLHQIGYNVNSQEDLTSKQRQNLLKLAIDNDFYSISGLLSFLDWLIARNKKVLNRDMSQAISKWTEDRFFVANYKTNTQRKVGVDTITVKNNDLPF